MDSATIEATITAWEATPDAARSTPTVTARAEGTRAVLTAGPFAWEADLPAPLGGGNAAPSPTAYLLGALAGCAVVFVRDTLAPQLGHAVDAVEATVRCEADARGLLGVGGAEPDLRGISVAVSVTTAAGDEAVAEIEDLWRQRCPILLALLKPMDVDVTFTRG